MAGDAKPADRFAVLLRRVSDIGLPTITRVTGCQTAHDPIARDLGNDRGRGDREAERVALDHGLHGAGNRRCNSSVDERGIRAYRQHRHGARHRQQSRTQDVKAVYFGHARRADPDTGGTAIGASPERLIADFTLLPGQHLRIIKLAAQHFRKAAGLEDHRSGHHRPGERPASGLVDAAHQPVTLPLDREIRHPPPPPTLVPRDRVAGKPTAVGGVVHAQKIAMLIACR